MERFTVTATATTFNGYLSQKPTPFDHKPHFRGPSFSSYLPTTAAADAELSIFDAERYFNSLQEQNNHPHKPPPPQPLSLDRPVERFSSVSSSDGYYNRNHRTNSSFHATPTECSEASWNSQSGLLTNPPGSVLVSVKALPLNERRKQGGSASKWLFGRNCPCSGKRSVEIEDPVHKNPNFTDPIKKESCRALVEPNEAAEMARLKFIAQNWAKEQEPMVNYSPENRFPADLSCRIVNSGSAGGGFSFPMLNPTAKAVSPPRDSLEVFRPFHRRLPFSSAGDIDGRRSFTFPVSPSKAPRGLVLADDDAASDSSSDLFEIESFSTTATYRRRDSLDERLRANLEAARGFANIETASVCAPSEASVEWSVATAEASAASEYAEEVRFAVPAEQEKVGGGRRRGNGLLGCRCEMAVNVGPGPHPVRAGAGQVESGRRADSGRDLAGLTARLVPKHAITRSYSARMSRGVVTR
ncbi:Protein PHYTOCHROME KINASE SUBSTRATE 4 [Acorus calamus]|uniref:Protein PHYTOCHROME KINASE SUBSTRATE 4 n=1 Tax=Acorus calamus TaxID=4465 RepID=A0AAV9CXS5_ACOCL|nr:Protein PHYTOCHROME KINASE SUBSTRATE 4 [Acorus calamus]